MGDGLFKRGKVWWIRTDPLTGTAQSTKRRGKAEARAELMGWVLAYLYPAVFLAGWAFRDDDAGLRGWRRVGYIATIGLIWPLLAAAAAYDWFGLRPVRWRWTWRRR